MCSDFLRTCRTFFYDEIRSPLQLIELMVASRLPPLPPIRDLIRVYGLSASQKFSQNFILDKNVTGNDTSSFLVLIPVELFSNLKPLFFFCSWFELDTIVRYAKISPMDDLVVEVGPGM